MSTTKMHPLIEKFCERTAMAIFRGPMVVRLKPLSRLIRRVTGRPAPLGFAFGPGDMSSTLAQYAMHRCMQDGPVFERLTEEDAEGHFLACHQLKTIVEHWDELEDPSEDQDYVELTGHEGFAHLTEEDEHEAQAAAAAGHNRVMVSILKREALEDEAACNDSTDKQHSGKVRFTAIPEAPEND